MSTGIYHILNTVDNKRYIGSSVNIIHRLRYHKQFLKKNKHPNSYLQNSYNKYGSEVFKFEQILECSETDLIFYEDLIVQGYDTLNRDFGYNLQSPKSTVLGSFLSGKNYKSGDQYHRITFIEPLPIKKNKPRKWKCQCSCGTEFIGDPWAIKHGIIKSCGCYRRERCSEHIQKFLSSPEWISKRTEKIRQNLQRKSLI